MSPRDSRSHNDSRANRLPYHPEPRQGRFGRVENWREAEERRQEQIRQQRRAHSRGANTASQPAVNAQSGAQRPVKGQSSAQQDAEQQDLQRRAAARHEARKKHPEINPWQQGRFGRVENWGDVERRQRQEAQAQAEAQAKAQAEAQARAQAKEAAPKQKPARSVRKTPTQQHVAELEQQRARSRASQQGPASTGAPASTTGAQSRAKQPVSQPQSALPKHPRQQAPAQSQDQQASERQQQPAHLQTQRHARQQQPNGAAGTQPFVPTDNASNYSRDSYVSRSKSSSPLASVRPAIANPGKHAAQTKSTGKRSKATSKIPQIPKKAIAVVAAVFALVIILGIGYSCSQSQEGGGNFAGVGGGAQTQASLPTPIMSESSGIIMHSAVAMEDLTEILIHNASYAYANEITTQLTEATNDDIINAHGTGRVASAQPTGDNWMTGEFIRCFRSGNAGPIMSAIDCGGPVGATVYAPVTGEVVMVKEYDLYGQIDDFRVHIQPIGRPDLDVVLIHLTDVTVQPGDMVTAGVTPIAKIRDIYQFLDESLQLKLYTAENDNGNHTHIQVNNANHPEYTALDELKPQPEPAPTPEQATPDNVAALP